MSNLHLGSAPKVSGHILLAARCKPLIQKLPETSNFMQLSDASTLLPSDGHEQQHYAFYMETFLNEN